MSRRFLLITLLTLVAPISAAVSPFLSSLARAQDIPDEIATARNQAVAEINSDNVYVRSGGSDNYYPTTKLNKGAAVTVVGSKFDWLKIVPPQGSFSYIAKAFVDKQPDGTGTVNRDDVNVRAGSELNALKTTVQGKLSQGQAVKIIEEVDEYYKIAPPADAYLYVNKQFVSFPKKLVANAAGGDAKTQASGGSGAAGSEVAGAGTTTRPVDETQIADGGATTQPAGAAVTSNAQAEFDKVEADFNAASAKAIEQQPIEQLTAAYQKVIADPQLPDSMRRIADFRMQTLKIRSDTKAQFLAVQKQQEEAKAKQTALKAEQEEIAQQIKQNDVKLYTAVGTLRTSSLQQGGGTLYRLTDPATGRTVCYVRSQDPKLATVIGQFVGVKGELATDAGLNMKVVTPAEFQQVEPNQLYHTIAAQIVPPSMLPQAASTEDK